MPAIIAAVIVIGVIWLYSLLQLVGAKWRAQERAYKTQVDFKNEFNHFPKDRNQKGGK